MSEQKFKFLTIMDAPCPVYLRTPNFEGAMTPYTDHGISREDAWRLLHELQAILEPVEPIKFSEWSGR